MSYQLETAQHQNSGLWFMGDISEMLLTHLTRVSRNLS